MNEQAKAWAGEFGDAYLARNRVDWPKRMPFWDLIMRHTAARSVLEVGCNAGWNMSAIQRVAPWARVVGIDVNVAAVHQAVTAGLDAFVEPLANRAALTANTQELVFTAGVLIHIPPANLPEMMRQIVAVSCDYVAAVEYEADEDTMIPYRGEQDLLWKRPYGRLYQDLGLTLVRTEHLAKRETGFDDCTCWLLRKGG